MLEEKEKGVNLQIRCHKETRNMLKAFVAKHGFRSYEEALLALLKKAEESMWFPGKERVY